MTIEPQSAPWWTSSVVYQIYPRSFADSDGNGIGDLRGVLTHVDHLAELGVGAVWLSPMYPSPQQDNGYDISDYTDIDPMFGTLDDFDAVLTALHDRGIRVILDLVVNHTSDEHPWFVEARSSRDNPKHDWYWWRPARPGKLPGEPGAEPTNWRSFFAGPAWQFDESTGEYYLHLFGTKQPDLNWENADLRQAIYQMMRWWLERGVDGFRLDVINLIAKDVAADGSLPDGVPGADGLGDGTPFFTGRPRVHDYLQEMHREVFAAYGDRLLLVGEGLGATLEDAQLTTDRARAELDMIFTFEHMVLDHGPDGPYDPLPLRLTELKATMNRWQQGLSEVGWNSLYWENHDQPRVVSRWGDEHFRRESATAWATVLHMHRGTPYVFQGEELGMTNAGFVRLDQYRDIEALNHAHAGLDAGVPEAEILAGLAHLGRDNARTPMQWNAGPHAGFTTGEPWIDINPNYLMVNAAAERADRRSVFHHYRRLIALRAADPVIQFGDFTMLLPEHPSVYALARRLGSAVILMAANLSSSDQEVDLSGPWGNSADLVLGNCDREPRCTLSLSLRPWEAVILRPVDSADQ
ncbi:alpha-glucosidase [Brooklawnia sp.]|uniref:glycoside hydrolase family 13 protein n=1 Tax=Brooklawnia sp. TaxID=2699740 RepID=UPI00311DB77D